MVLNSSGTKVAEARHRPYGIERWTSGTLPTDYRFTGQLWEQPLGLYHMGARWYEGAGDVVKTGISGQPLNLNGTPPRANRQVNALNVAVGSDVYDARVVQTNIPGRAKALEWERDNAQRLWVAGNSLSLHKRPRPWE